MISDERKACIERFFRTHQDELVYVPEMTHDQVVEKFNQLLPTILQSEIIFQVIRLPGLSQHHESIVNLLTCLINFKCANCYQYPEIIEGIVFSAQGASFFTEGVQALFTSLPDRMSTIKEGFHFWLNGYCPSCDRTQCVISSYDPDTIPIINTFTKEILFNRSPSTTVGFIVLPSWIQTYFEKDQYDKKFAYKTVWQCTKLFCDLLKSQKQRRLPMNQFQQELGEGLQDTLLNLIPQVQTEKEFCGLIKGVFHYTAIQTLALRKKIKLPLKKFKFQEILRQVIPKIPSVALNHRKKLLANAILLVGDAYYQLTHSSLTIPTWVAQYQAETG